MNVRVKRKNANGTENVMNVENTMQIQKGRDLLPVKERREFCLLGKDKF